MQQSEYDQIFNDGERLIPGESHDLAETVRHKSSYRFFRAIIEADLAHQGGGAIAILDLGCGVGHGAYTLAGIPGSEITAVDPSPEAIRYAEQNYNSANLTYVNSDAESFLTRGRQFDYIVSRHALEHVENGLELALKFGCRRRLMVNVPFREPEGNIHHRVHFIEESSFTGYDGAEFFYEDLQGVTETQPDRLEFANSIVAVLTNDDSPPVKALLDFPFPAWRPTLLEKIGVENSAKIRAIEAKIASLEAEKEGAKQNFSRLSSDFSRSFEILQSVQEELVALKSDVYAARRPLISRVLRRIASIIRR